MVSAAKFEVNKPEVKFVPGKYIASKSSNVYHEPKCDWAKKIHKSRQLWFASKEEAWEKGFKAHSCVK
jgi:methylphosphotriester-DNA--protein-cysteine methyltransferase